MLDKTQLQQTAMQVRRDILRMVTQAASGHPGGSMSSTDLLTTLFFNVMDFGPEGWTREGRGQDVFILSAGHITPVYYSLLSLKGFFPRAELATFRKMGTRLQGHPCVHQGLAGITQVSGSLGQGLSAALGIALGKKLDGDTHDVYVLVGDGESEEGQIWEAALFGANRKVDNLIAITDWNGQQIDGRVDDVAGLGDLKAKWEAFGWAVEVCEDGHDFDALARTYARAALLKGKGRPVMLLMKTDMGHGVDFMCGTCQWHGKAPSEEQCAAALAQLSTTAIGDF